MNDWEVGARALVLFKAKTWDLYNADNRICSVCLRIGQVIGTRAHLEAMLEQDLTDEERQYVASQLAVLSSVPLPVHE
jgi:hypothetical protein